jgi:hypothetical protein
MAVWERALAAEVEQTIITSPLDAAQIVTPRPPQVVPIAVDLESPIEMRGNQALPEGDCNLGFLGDMSTAYSETAVVHFIEQIFPAVQAICPRAHFWIIGRDPTRSIRRLAGGCVHVTGAVPDFKPYLQRLQVVVAPMQFGSGIKNRVLQAMSQGVPVVGSSIANEGLDAAPGVELYVANAPQEFAGHLIQLLRQPSLRRQVGEAGKAFVQKRLHPDRIAEQLELALLAARNEWNRRHSDQRIAA